MIRLLSLLRWLPAVRRAFRRREIALQRARLREQIHRTVVNLLREVFPERTPFQYDTALSFLQPATADAPLDPADPVRVTLFFPKLPLALDIVGPDRHPDWAEAREWTDREAWQRDQERRARVEQLLSRYRIPYLVLTTHEPLDPVNLRQRVRERLGRNP